MNLKMSTSIQAETTGFVGADQLEASLVGAEIVVIPAGVLRKPGMTRFRGEATN